MFMKQTKGATLWIFFTPKERMVLMERFVFSFLIFAYLARYITGIQEHRFFYLLGLNSFVFNDAAISHSGFCGNKERS